MKSLTPSALPLLASVLTANAFKFPDCINGVLAKTKACDPTASAPERAASLVEQLTIDEKLVNLVEYAHDTSLRPLLPPLSSPLSFPN